MKKIANISLFMFCIALVLVNSAGYFIYFKAETYKAKKQFKTKLRSIESLDMLPKGAVRIAFAKSDKIQPKFKEKFEFELNGNLYDIIKSTDKVDSIIYYALLDRDETQLFASFLKHLNSEKKNEQNKNKLSLSFEYLGSQLGNNTFIPKDIKHFNQYITPLISKFNSKIFHPPCLVS